jgi:hypothetical protein
MTTRKRLPGQKFKPEEAFNEAYANANRAAEMLQQMADKNVGNLKRKETAKARELLQKALCASLALDNWRKDNPLPQHREDE